MHIADANRQSKEQPLKPYASTNVVELGRGRSQPLTPYDYEQPGLKFQDKMQNPFTVHDSFMKIFR